MNAPILDTIDFTLRAEHVIVNRTVKLVANVVTLVAGETSEDMWRADLRAMMKRVVDADWQFSNMARGTDSSGFERVTLTASVRVPEAENYDLDGRAKLASRKGANITSITADTTVPLSMIEEAESELRVALIGRAQQELAEMRTALGDGTYRLHKLAFGPLQGQMPGARAASTRVFSKEAYGTGFSDDEGGDALGNASKLSMQVVVQCARPTSPE